MFLFMFLRFPYVISFIIARICFSLMYIANNKWMFKQNLNKKNNCTNIHDNVIFVLLKQTLFNFFLFLTCHVW